ncbi:MAG: hypothetical protein B6241_08575 [Spirochaetaceae bacterium 4572_59]|nr:MAG: hypothetical protein B6241_08575 [Spirochaetaceae bacterium 4572_59]
MRKLTKILSVLILGIFFSSPLFSQSLQDNPDYRKSLELKKQSEQAFDEAEYDEARTLAEESKLYAEKSDAWIQMMLKRYRANSALRRVETELRSAAKVKAEVNFPEAYASGKALYDEAYKLFQDENYELSYEKSLKALDVMSVIEYVRAPPTAPAGTKVSAYTVRLIPENRDCLWNIAGYNFVYGDPWKWELLYEANKDQLPDPNNPRLILPGMVIKIPSASGELRSGTWTNGFVK